MVLLCSIILHVSDRWSNSMTKYPLIWLCIRDSPEIGKIHIFVLYTNSMRDYLEVANASPAQGTMEADDWNIIDQLRIHLIPNWVGEMAQGLIGIYWVHRIIFPNFQFLNMTSTEYLHKPLYLIILFYIVNCGLSNRVLALHWSWGR